MTHRRGRATLALVGLLLPALASAAPKAHHAHASLDVTRQASAHSCPADKEVRREVTSILGYGPFDKGARRRVSVLLWASGGTYHARIQLKDAQTKRRLGVRELSAPGPTCEELARAMALAIALAIDPLAQPPPAVHPPAAPPAAPLAATPLQDTAPLLAPLPGGVSSTPGASASGTKHPAAKPRKAPSALPATAVEALLAADLTPLAPDAGALAEAPAASTAADAGTLAEPLPAVADAGVPSPSPVVAVAALVDAGVAEPSPEPVVAVAAVVDAGVPSPSPEVVAAPAAAPAEKAPAVEPPPWRGLLGVGGEWTVGLVPSRAFGVFLHGGMAFEVFLVELEVAWLPSTSFSYQGGSISSSLWTAKLVGCGRLSSFGLCLVAQTGPLTSQGTGYATVSSQTTWTAALGARGQWDWVFAHPVGLRLQVEGLVNLVQTHIQVGTDTGPATAWTSPTFALTLGAGFFWVF